MLIDRVESKWIDTFTEVFELCRVRPGEVVAILSETQSRAINVHLAELALLRLKARAFHVVLPTPVLEVTIPVRSTGASNAIAELQPVVAALAASSMIVDVTVEGTMHSKEGRALRAQGARVLYISNDHPEILERLKADSTLVTRVRNAAKMLAASRKMHVTSQAGTDLHIDLSNALVGGGNAGIVDGTGQLATWPGGTCSCFPRAGAVNGKLVLAQGDINLTFKRYLENSVSLTLKDDFVTDIGGEGLDAALMKSYFAAWGDRNAYGTSHVGWGMNPTARWDAMIMYDKRDHNGTEQRAYAGNFLFSTGANPSASRYTLGHFDLPVGNCTISLDGQAIIERGKLCYQFD